MTPRIVVATRNLDKFREITDKLGDKYIELLSLSDFPSVGEVLEDQPDLVGNAIKKAVEISRNTGFFALSDDTGLEVDALGGAPGVMSARFAGPRATYDSNCAKLLDSMHSVPVNCRTASFRTVMCLRTADGLYCVEGTLKGTIGLEKKGANGFGYDPVFVLPDGRALAELDLDEKNGISHRGVAMDKMKRLLAFLYQR